MNRGTMMVEDTHIVEERAPVARAIGSALLAVGGLAAAFGAAVCCAVPVGLGVLGLGSAWLSGAASMTAPYQPLLLWIALACVALGLILAYAARPATTCSSGICASWVNRATKSGLWTASVLIGGALVFG